MARASAYSAICVEGASTRQLGLIRLAKEEMGGLYGPCNMDFKMAINFEPIDADPSYGDVSLISGPSPTRIRSKLNFFWGLLLHTQEISHFTNNGSEAGGGISVESHGLKSVFWRIAGRP